MWLKDLAHRCARRGLLARARAEQTFWSYPRRTRRRMAARATTPRRAPLIEPLEQRTLLSTFVVDTLLDNVVEDEFTSLREAIVLSENNAGADIIEFDASLHGSILLGEVLPAVSEQLEIRGDQRIALDGQDASTLLDLNPGSNLTIDGMMLTGGLGGSGGVTTFGSTATLTINNSTVTNNVAASGVGGAFYLINGGTLNIDNSVISNNEASLNAGGAIYNRLGSVTITNSLISGNTAGLDGTGGNNSGGGIYNSGGTIDITNTTFEFNVARISGGGIFNGNQPGDPPTLGSVTITNSTFSGNRTNTSSGGGIFNAGDMTVTNSTISGNTANVGAGFVNQTVGGSVPDLTITGSTIANNVATVTTPSAGAGIRNAAGSVTLTNTIVANNLTGNGGTNDIFNLSGGTTSGTFNLISDASTAGGLVDGTNNNIVGADPMLSPLGHFGGPTRTHAIGENSPAIDAGTAGQQQTDQRGNARTFDVPAAQNVGDGTDIGAFEYQTGDDALLPPSPDGLITGVIFHDANDNGIQDDGEQGLRDIPIAVLLDSEFQANVITQADGSFFYRPSTTGLFEFQITEDDVPQLTGQETESSEVFFPGVGLINAAPIGFHLPGWEFGGNKFDDFNANGNWDAGESTLPGAGFFIDTNGDGVFDETEHTTATGADGRWMFHNAAPQDQVVREVPDARFQQTSPDGPAFSQNGFVAANTTINDAILGDFNGDQRLDVALITDNDIHLRFQDDRGALGLPILVPFDSGQSNLSGGVLDVGQFDTGGTTDLFVAYSQGWAVLLNDGNGTFSQFDLQFNGGSDVEVVDFDGNGLSDFVYLDSQPSTLHVIANLGGPLGGGFGQDTIISPSFQDTVSDWVLGDLNGDTHLDAAIATINGQTGTTIHALINDTQGNLASQATHLFADMLSPSLTAGNVTGNERDDIIVGFGGVATPGFESHFGSQFNTLSFHGQGFDPVVTSHTPLSIDAIDVIQTGGDARDLAVVNTETVYIVQGDGMGGFAGYNPVVLGPAPDLAGATTDIFFYHIEIADFNHDGREDVFSLHSDVLFGVELIDLFHNVGNAQIARFSEQGTPGDLNFGNAPAGTIITGRKIEDLNNNGVEDRTIAAPVFFNETSGLSISDGARDLVLSLTLDEDSGGSLQNPAGIAIGPDGNYYVSNTGNDSITIFDPFGGFVGTFIDGQAQDAPLSPRALDFDAQGNLHVVSGAADVFSYNPQGNRYNTFSINLQGADINDIEIGPDGKLYLVNTGNAAVHELATDGQILRTFTSIDLDSPFGVALDGNRLLVTNGDNLIVPFDLTTGLAGLPVPIMDDQQNITLKDIDRGRDGNFFAVDSTTGVVRGIDPHTLLPDAERIIPIGGPIDDDDEGGPSTTGFFADFIALGGERGIEEVDIFIDLNNDGIFEQKLASGANENDVAITPDGTFTSNILLETPTSTVSDIEARISISAESTDDLDISLIAPNGQRVTLATGISNTSLLDDVTFSDTGWQTLFEGQGAQQGGFFKPAQPFALLNGADPNGTWQLEITNRSQTESATLNGWSLEVVHGEPLTETNQRGEYRLVNLPQQEVDVLEGLPAGSTQTGPAHNDLDLTGTPQLIGDINFLNTEHGTIKGRVFGDANEDGLFKTVDGDTLLAGQTVFIDTNNNGVLDQDGFAAIDETYDGLDGLVEPGSGILETRTINSGDDRVASVLVTFDISAFEGDDNFISVTSPDGTQIDLDLSLIENGTLSQTLTDFNGQRASGEWRVDAWAGYGTQGVGDSTMQIDGFTVAVTTGEQSAVTMSDDPATQEVDETGLYCLENVPPGAHVVRLDGSGIEITTPATPQVEDFEDVGIDEISTLGDAQIVDNTFGDPTSGQFQLLLTTSAGAHPAGDLDLFAGLPGGTIAGLGGNEPGFEGSAVSRTVRVDTGDTVSFDWNFFTDETDGGDPALDYAFVSISDGTGASALAFADDAVNASTTPFFSETGFQNFQHTFSTSGLFTITVGVVDADDAVVDSGLTIDDFTVTGEGSDGLHVIDLLPGRMSEENDFGFFVAFPTGDVEVELQTPGRYQMFLENDHVVVESTGETPVRLLDAPIENIDSLTVNGTDGDDTLVVDRTGGNPIPTQLTFNGGGQTGDGDSLEIIGGSASNVTHTFTNESDGNVVINDETTQTITYTGLEPVLDTIGASSRQFVFTGGAETIDIIPGPNTGELTIDSTLGESVTFIANAGSITVDAGDGDDVINVTDFGATITSSLIINGGDGNDTVNWNTADTIASVAITVESININNHVNTTGNQTFVGPVSVDGATQFNGTLITFTDILDADATGLGTETLSTGSVIFAGQGSGYDVEIGAAGSRDQLDVTGTVTINTGATLDLTVIDDFVPTGGEALVIINNDGGDPINGTFADLPEGAIVSSDLFGSGLTATITYTGGDGNDVVINVQPTFTVGNRVWHDINGDGLDNNDEPGQDALIVELLTAQGVFIRDTVTAGGGFYSFEHVPAGDYIIGVAKPSQYDTFTTQNVGGENADGNSNIDLNSSPSNRTSVFTVSDGDRLDIDAGLYAYASITGRTIEDVNGDGQIELGAPGVNGFQIELVDADTGQVVTTTTSGFLPADFTPGSIAVGSLDAARGFDDEREQSFNLMPVGTFDGGIRVASGDVNGDGIADLITSAGAGLSPIVTVYDGTDATQLYSFFAYDTQFFGGVFVASGDINGDGCDDIITGAGAGAPTVRIFDGTNPANMLGSFDAFDAPFTGGVRVAAGDVNGDGQDDIITGAGPGGGSQVKVFDGGDTQVELADFFAFEQGFQGGVFVGAGDINGDGLADVITGADAGGTPQVRVFNGADGEALLADFFAFSQGFQGGVRVAAGDVNGDGRDDIITGAGAGSGADAHVKVFDGTNTDAAIESFFAFDQQYQGGVFVSGAMGATGGHYRFDDLDPGDYFIRQANRPGWLQTSPPQFSVYSASLDSGDTAMGVDFASTALGAIVGYKFVDFDGNGIDNDEPRLAGVMIELTGVDGLGNDVNLSTVTDGDGVYRFDNLVPGVYSIDEVPPQGAVATTQLPVVVTLASNELLIFDADATPTSTVLFDFDDDDVTVTEQGYIGVQRDDFYDAQVGYGWDQLVRADDRGTLADQDPLPDLRRDTHKEAAPRTFSVDLAPGTYEVTVTMGDAGSPRDHMTVTAEGNLVLSDVTAAAGQWQVNTFAVNVLDGQLNLTFDDVAGGDSFWVVNGLEIQRTNAPTIVETSGLGIGNQFASVVSIGEDGELRIDDVNGGVNDNLNIRSDFELGRYIISDPDNLLLTDIQSATGNLTNTIFVPFAAVTGDALIVNTLGGDDALTVDFSLGNFARTIVYSGGENGNDALHLTGGTFAHSDFNFVNENDGQVFVENNATITYTGLEPITSTLNVDEVTLVYSNASEDIDVTDEGNGRTTVDSSSGESVTFNNPTTLLHIIGGEGDNDVNVFSLADDFNADLRIEGSGEDIVNWYAGDALIHDAFFNVDEIRLFADVNAGGGQTYDGLTFLFDDVTLRAPNDGVRFDNTLDAIGDAHDLTIEGPAEFFGAIGTFGALGDLIVDADGEPIVAHSAITVNGLLSFTSQSDGGETPDPFASIAVGGDISADDALFSADSILIDESNIAVATGDVTFDGAGEMTGNITGGDLIKSGEGTFALTGDTPYVNVQGGRLNLFGHSAGGGEVQSGGTLGGDATFGEGVQLLDGATLAPGASAGLFAASSFDFSAGSTFEVELGDAENDAIITDPDGVSINAAAELQLLPLEGYDPAFGDEFTIIDNRSANAVAGTFAGLPEGAQIEDLFGSGLNAFITYQGGDGNDVVINVAPAGSISGRVWHDLDGDGIDDDDTSVVLHNVDLLHDGEVIDSTTTDEGGAYAFLLANPGAYQVRIFAGAFDDNSPQFAGQDATIDSDINPATKLSDVITVSLNDDIEDIDAGLYNFASVDGFKYLDENGNGQQDEGETGQGFSIGNATSGATYNIQGQAFTPNVAGNLGQGEPVADNDGNVLVQTITIDFNATPPSVLYLYDHQPTAANAAAGVGALATGQHIGNGTYQFTGVAVPVDEKTYFVLPQATPIRAHHGNAYAGGDNMFNQSGTIREVINGFDMGFTITFAGDNPGGEPGLAGSTFFVDYDDDGYTEGVDPTGISDENGEFTIENVRPGAWFVSELDRPGYEQTEPDEGGYVVTVASGGVNAEPLIFGNRPDASDTTVSGVKFIDANGDGVRNDGEVGLDDVRIYVDVNGNHTYDQGEPTAITAEGGAFTITDIPVGDFDVREVVPEGYVATNPLDITGSGAIAIHDVIEQGDSAGPGRTADGLDAPFDVTVSPDGRWVYTAGFISNQQIDSAIGIFRRDVGDGDLRYVGAFTEADLPRLQGVSGLAVSPDGTYLYAVSANGSAIITFQRNAVNGKLTHLQTLHNGDAAGTEGLLSARRVTVSGDGQSVYVASTGNNTVSHFSVGAGGLLTQEGTFIIAVLVGSSASPQDVAVSSDGKQVYVAGTNDDGDDFLATFDRDGEGALTYARADTVSAGLGGAVDVTLSGDDRFVYVAGRTDNALAVFSRNTATGQLSLVQTVDDVNGASAIVISADGTQAFAAEFNDDAVSVFDRDPLTGRLTFDTTITGGDLDGAFALALTPGGDNLLVTSINADTITSFSRDVGGIVPGGFPIDSQLGGAIDGLAFGNFTGIDLVAQIDEQNLDLSGGLAPGGFFNLPFNITNLGDATAMGTIDYHVYASLDGQLDRDSDLLIHAATGVGINLLPDQMVSLNPQVTLNGSFDTGDYTFIVDVNPSRGTPETDFTNNADATDAQLTVDLSIAGDGSTMVLANAFGDLFRVTLFGGNVSLDADLIDDDGEPAYDLTIGGGIATSRVLIRNISDNDGRLNLGDVTITGAFATFDAAPTNLLSDFTAANINTLIMGDWDANHVVRINGNNNGAAVNVDIDRWIDVDFESLAALGNFNATVMLDTDDQADRFVAPSVTSLFVEGDASEDVQSNVDLTVAGALGSAVVNGAITGNWTLGSAGTIVAGDANEFTLTVAGALTSLTLADVVDALIDITGAAGSIFATNVTDGLIRANSVGTIEITGNWENTTPNGSIGPDADPTNDELILQQIAAATSASRSATSILVRGAAKGITVRTLGNINSLHFGRLQNSTVFAGVRNDFTRNSTSDFSFLPDSSDDFARQATIGQLTVTGLTAEEGNPGLAKSFVDSIIAAWNIGNAAIREVDSNHYRTGDKHGIAGVNINRFERFAGGIGRITIYGGEEDLPDKYGNFHLRVIEPNVAG